MGNTYITKETVKLVTDLNNRGLGNFQIARRVGISESTVSRILNRNGGYASMIPEDWVFSEPKTRKKNFIITQEMVDEVVEMNQQGICNSGIAHSTGLAHSSISDILNRKFKFEKMIPKDVTILDNRYKREN